MTFFNTGLSENSEAVELVVTTGNASDNDVDIHTILTDAPAGYPITININGLATWTVTSNPIIRYRNPSEIHFRIAENAQAPIINMVGGVSRDAPVFFDCKIFTMSCEGQGRDMLYNSSLRLQFLHPDTLFCADNILVHNKQSFSASSVITLQTGGRVFLSDMHIMNHSGTPSATPIPFVGLHNDFGTVIIDTKTIAYDAGYSAVDTSPAAVHAETAHGRLYVWRT